METARRRFGDAFSVSFMGFESPMVMLSDPDVVRELYTTRDHSLPPGRTFALRPLLGDRSVLLLEGREHLDRRRLMLPAFHGERMRAYESVMREATEREIAGWPAGRAFAVHPSMQAITLEVILRAVFGVSDERAPRAPARAADRAARRDRRRRACSSACCSRGASAATGRSRRSPRCARASTTCSPKRSPSAAAIRAPASARTSSPSSSPRASTTAARWTTTSCATSC